MEVLVGRVDLLDDFCVLRKSFVGRFALSRMNPADGTGQYCVDSPGQGGAEE